MLFTRLFRSMFLLLTLLGTAPLTHAATFTVSKTADTADGTCNSDCSLREAITAAGAAAGADTIVFNSSLNGGTISLTTHANVGNGDSAITFADTGGVEIDATALAGGLTIDDSTGITYRLFSIPTGSIVTFKGLTLANGGGASFKDFGGTMSNSGTLTFNRCTLSGNSVKLGQSGGAIESEGNGSSLTMTDCTLSGNSADSGGAITASNSTVVTLTRCTLSGNSATNGNGGAVSNTASVSLIQCTVANNMATGASLGTGYGGGIFSFGGSVSMNHCTIAGNTANGNASNGNGGGVFADGNFLGGFVIANTILTGNAALGIGRDFYESGNASVAFTGRVYIAKLGGNGFTADSNVLTSNDGAANLAPLGNYGGPTQTMPPLAGSPVLDQADTTAHVGTPLDVNFTSDQRGSPRPIDGDAAAGAVADLGAVELDPLQTGPNFVVNKTADTNDGNCGTDCSLREALSAAAANAGADTVTFVAGLNGGTITLGAEIVVTDSGGVTVDATSLSGGITVDGGPGSNRIFSVSSASVLTLNSLTLTGGNGRGASNDRKGGAIYNGGTLTMTQCTISSNSTLFNGGGGAIYNGGTLSLTGCALSGNSAGPSGGTGGAIYNGSGTTLTMTGCTLSDNSAMSAHGGAIYNVGTLTLTNCTLSGNSALGGGGAIINYDTLTLRHCTVSGNTAGANFGGGGVDVYNGSALVLENSIVAGNSLTGAGTGPDIRNIGTITANGANIVQTAPAGSGTVNGSGTIANVNPLLAPLANNGGPTQTMALLAGSPAINAAVGSSATTDQRGFPVIGTPDIGAYEALPSLSISDVTITEGNTGTTNSTFTVTLSQASTQTVTVNYATGASSDSPAAVGLDYVAVPLSTLTFMPGQTSKTVSVTVNGDGWDEFDEQFMLNLSSPVNATISDGQGVGTITDDDASPTLSIKNITVTEGNSGTVNANFVVTMSAVSLKTVTVDYATAVPITFPATAGVDYVAVPSTALTFLPGQNAKTVTVLVNGDTLDEANETFTVTLSNPTNANLATATGTGTITDNDAAPILNVNNPTARNEGSAAVSGSVTFTVTLSAVSGRTVTVNYATANGVTDGATAGSDFTNKTGALSFSPGQTSKTVTVNFVGDAIAELNENFFLDLSGAVNAGIGTRGKAFIRNDDGPGISITNAVTVNEGNSGTTAQVFLVSLSAASTDTVKVNFATANGPAGTGAGPTDYTAQSGTLTFAPGETLKAITVLVIGDTAVEVNEKYFVNLSSPTFAIITGSQASGFIRNDDSAGILAIEEPSE